MTDRYQNNHALAQRILHDIDRTTPYGHITIPSAGTYRSVFAWDSGWVYFWLRELDPERARVELETMFHFQCPDGRMPHETMLEPMDSYRGLRRLQLWLLRHGFDADGRAYLIDPPSYLWAALDCVSADLTPEYRERNSVLVTSVVRVLRWLERNRTVAGLPDPFNQLPVLLHPLESGTDHSAGFDLAYGGAFRLYLDSFRSMSRLKKRGWNVDSCRDTEVLFFDLTFLGLYLHVLEHLQRLQNRGEARLALTPEAYEMLQGISVRPGLYDAFMDAFLNQDTLRFDSYYLRRGELKRVANPTFSSMIPFILDHAPDDVARRAVTEHGVPGGTFFHAALPDYNQAGADRQFMHRKLWRGSCSWMNMNFLLYRMLKRNGFDDEAERMTGALTACVDREGSREFYHATSGKGGGCRGFAWNGLLLAMR